MIIGVISDTHDRLEDTGRALAYFAGHNVGLVVHCGDWKSLDTMRFIADRAAELGLPVRGVLGNNDIDPASFVAAATRAPGNFTIREGIDEFSADGPFVAVYHGHHAPTLRRVIQESGYDITLLGHTHKPRIEKIEDEYQDPRLIVNPGSTAFSIPRSRNWKPSVALVDTRAMAAEIIYL